MKLDFGDVLIVVGMVLMLVALYFVDWRLMVGVLGLMLCLMGIVRLVFGPGRGT